MMKTRLPRQEFQEALTAASHLTGGRTTKPILSCVKLDLHPDGLGISATDGESGLCLRVPVLSVDRSGATVVPADRLLQIVRELPDVEIALEVSERHCVIRGQGSEFKIFVQNPEDFPPVPGFDDEAELVIDRAQLAQMIAMTLYAAARETSRYAINGVLWQKEGKRLFLVATDGRRLARAGGALIESSSGDFEVIVPAKALHIFDRVFGPSKDGAPAKIDVKMLPNQVLMRSSDRVLATSLVEGHFPKYQDVIPKDNDKVAVLDRADFHAGIRRAALLTTEDSRAVRLSFQSGQLVIRSQSPEQGEARIEMPIQYDDELVEIGFNPNFLSDALKVVPYEQIRIELQANFKPGIICGDDRNDFLYVVMPVSLS